MNEPQIEPSDDMLERALNALRDEPIPEGPSPRMIRETLLVLRNGEVRSSFFRRVFSMARTHKSAASILIFLGGAAVYSAFILVGGLATVSFAQVADQLRDIHSMTCKITVPMVEPGKPMTEKMSVVPGKVRMEMPGGVIVIGDSQAHRSVVLDPSNKSATIIESSTTKPSVTEAIGRGTEMIDILKNLANSKSEAMPDRDINGIRAKGFRVKYHDSDALVYVDPKTKLPIQVELGANNDSGLVTLSDIRFDVDLAPELFSTDVPAGYTTATMQGPDVPQLNTDLGDNAIPILRRYAEHKNGQFPPKLDDLIDIRKTAAIPKPANISNPADRQLFVNMYMTISQVRKYQRGRDWDYFPTAGKLGEADKLILWYQPTGTKTYKAIYGDLHVAEVTIDQLPKAELPPGL